MSILQDSRRINLCDAYGYTYDVRKARACEAIDEPGFTLLGQSSGQGAAGRGPAWEKACSPEAHPVQKGEAGPTHLPG